MTGKKLPKSRKLLSTEAIKLLYTCYGVPQTYLLSMVDCYLLYLYQNCMEIATWLRVLLSILIMSRISCTSVTCYRICICIYSEDKQKYIKHNYVTNSDAYKWRYRLKVATVSYTKLCYLAKDSLIIIYVHRILLSTEDSKG